MPHRYFTTEIADGTATLRGADAHHLARVMRGKLGIPSSYATAMPWNTPPPSPASGMSRVEFSVEPGYPSAAEPTVEVTLLAGLSQAGQTGTDHQARGGAGRSPFVPFFSRYCVAAPKKKRSRRTSATTALRWKPPSSAAGAFCRMWPPAAGKLWCRVPHL